MLTVENYETEIQNVDWSKVPEEIKEEKDDIPTFLEFYDENKDFKEAVDIFIDLVNQSQKKKADKPKKSSPKKQQINTKSKFDVGDVVSFDYKGTQADDFIGVITRKLGIDKPKVENQYEIESIGLINGERVTDIVIKRAKESNLEKLSKDVAKSLFKDHNVEFIGNSNRLKVVNTIEKSASTKKIEPNLYNYYN